MRIVNVKTEVNDREIKEQALLFFAARPTAQQVQAVCEYADAADSNQHSAIRRTYPAFVAVVIAMPTVNQWLDSLVTPEVFSVEDRFARAVRDYWRGV